MNSILNFRGVLVEKGKNLGGCVSKFIFKSKPSLKKVGLVKYDGAGLLPNNRAGLVDKQAGQVVPLKTEFAQQKKAGLVDKQALRVVPFKTEFAQLKLVLKFLVLCFLFISCINKKNFPDKENNEIKKNSIGKNSTDEDSNLNTNKTFSNKDNINSNKEKSNSNKDKSIVNKDKYKTNIAKSNENKIKTQKSESKLNEKDIKTQMSELKSNNPDDTNENEIKEKDDFTGIHTTNVSLGDKHTCASYQNGKINKLKCWGRNTFGQLGIGNRIDYNSPVNVYEWYDIQSRSKVIGLAAGDEHNCIIVSSNLVSTTGIKKIVKCWGRNESGQLGVDPVKHPYIRTPINVNFENSVNNITQITAGFAHTCVLVGDKVSCWGTNSSGQLGRNDTSLKDYIPREVPELKNVVMLKSNYYHNCVILKSGVLNCWGNNTYGQLGIGNNINSFKPVKVDLSEKVVNVALGQNHTCALLISGKVKCWGLNTQGQLGNGNLDSNVPLEVEDLEGVVEIDAGGEHNCVSLNNGKIKCWGLNTSGQLGNGDWSISKTNKPVEIVKNYHFNKVSLGFNHSCAVTNLDKLYCWGHNSLGELGVSNNKNSIYALKVPD